MSNRHFFLDAFHSFYYNAQTNMETEQFQTQSDFMAHCAKVLMEKYPSNPNFRFVADQVGVSTSIFENILKKEGRATSFSNAIKIVRAACSDGQVKRFIEKFYPKMLPHFSNVYPNNSDVPFPSAEAEDFFKMASTYKIMLYALNTPDLTREEIGREFGRKGLTILDQLIQRKIIKKTNGENIAIQGPLNLEQPALYALFKNLLTQNYDIDHFGEKDNWLSVQTQAVDLEKVMPVLREACTKMNRKISDILNDPKYKGRDIVWVGLVSDSLCKQKNDLASTKGLIQ